MTYIILIILAVAVVAYLVIPKFRELVKGWKTTIMGVVVSIIGFLQTFDLGKIVAPDKVGYWLLGIGILAVILRAMTTTAIGKKEP